MSWLRRLARILGKLVPHSVDPKEGRCGAIALRFVYKRLGRRASLEDIWKAVKSPKESLGPGYFSSAGYLMCRDALDRGLGAMHIEARYEARLELMANARRRRVEVIFTHGTADPAWRHCSVLEGIDGGTADVFDPSLEGFKSMSCDELLEMWGRLGDTGGGHELLAVSNVPVEPVECQSCGTSIPPEIQCPEPLCRKPVPLEPGFLLGCPRRECPEATWESIACPSCGIRIDDLKPWSAW